MSEFTGFNFYKSHGKDSATAGIVARGKCLELNGQPLRIISGAIHYFRIIPEYWRDRLLKLKVCGCNCVETYVPWNFHEALPGEFSFEGIRNVRQFIQLAAELDLLVIFRPGPYICAEWEFGGLPSWLLQDPDMAVRTTYPAFMEATDRFFSNLLSQVIDLQFTQNGPIIMVQIENEYGAYGSDQNYMDAIAGLLRKHGITELLFTSNGPEDLELGQIPVTNAWMTVNEQTNMTWVLDRMEAVQPDRPLMVMEYWTGWFDHWHEKRHTISLEKYVAELTTVLERGASVNLFVFHGGSNFGFFNGANAGLKSGLPYQPTIQSYDYDCLVSEHGALTAKWHKTRELLAKFQLLPDNLPVPRENLSATYGRFPASNWMALSDCLTACPAIQVISPVAMEFLTYNAGYGQAYGFIAYEKDVSDLNGELIIEEMHDRAIVIVDYGEQMVLEYTVSMERNHKIAIPTSSTDSIKPRRLTILVENMGRVNFTRAPLTLNHQRKGLQGTVTLNNQPLLNWTIRPMEFLDFEVEKLFLPSCPTLSPWTPLRPGSENPSLPGLFKFTVTLADPPQDTFLDLSQWGRGVCWVNGFNLGRYWPSAGPQRTLYLPGPLLTMGENVVLLFELEKFGAEIRLVGEPSLG